MVQSDCLSSRPLGVPFYLIYAFGYQFDFYLTMFGGVSVGMFGAVSFMTSAAPDPLRQVPQRGSANAPGTSSAYGKEAMEPRLLAHFMGAGVPDDILNKLGAAGVTTLSLFASLGGDEKGFRAFLERPGLEIEATDLLSSVSQARVVTAWRTANTMNTVEIETQAKRSLAN